MIDGSILIGADTRQANARFQAIAPATNTPLAQSFSEADGNDVAAACALAATAAPTFAALSPADRAAFLDAIADAILAIGDDLITTAMAESGLPRMRLEGERGRTTGQLRLFASELRRGEWLDVVIDRALPDRTPPRGDLRRMNLPLGPVAVFGASNFPLAFSVAGGDTASALAAGCPVVAKGHPAHPGTGELVARAIALAAANCGLPAGVFSYLPGTTHDLGATLAGDFRIRAVGFTGSRAGGIALARIAAARAEPIPVYAEMSAINPVVLLPAALAARAQALGAAFAGSLTMGAGQFCTNPGLIIALDGPDLGQFKHAASAALAQSEPAVMLTPGIHAAYAKGVAALDGNPAVARVAGAKAAVAPNRCAAALFETTATQFLADARLRDEVFGASSILVVCADIDDMIRVITGLEGQLTATLQADAGDADLAARLIPLLAERAGRVLANGWPTGVEVCHAMVHGGPWPATTDARSTSVGTLAMGRFLRPVCFQDLAPHLLPPALHDDNPWRLPRTINGAREIGA